MGRPENIREFWLVLFGWSKPVRGVPGGRLERWVGKGSFKDRMPCLGSALQERSFQCWQVLGGISIENK